jgi:twinkle protein
MPSTKYGVKGASEITDMADNVLVVFSQKEEIRDYDCLLNCEKQRHGESEPKYRLNFDERSLQFKSFATATRLSPEEWQRNAWS